MACIWMLHNTSTGGWRPRPIRTGTEAGARPAGEPEHRLPAGLALLSVAGPDADRPRWALLVGRSVDVRVNGEPVGAGIRVLRDRDAIVTEPGRVVFFSTERPPERVTIPADRIDTRCARCNTPFAAGVMAVCCPGCASWYHAVDGGERPLPCWSHQPHCSICRRATDATYAWTPECL